jgi:threonine/homoserine/homoserine lactone efflux protein
VSPSAFRSTGSRSALGVAAVIENSTFLYETLRWGGAAYLLWLAWDAWSTADDIAAEDMPSDHDERVSAFRRGLITNLLNPKAAIFYIAVLPDFLNPAGGRVAVQIVALSAVYVTIATLIHAAIVLFASRLRGVIVRPERVRRVRRVLALALAAIAVWLAWSTAR